MKKYWYKTKIIFKYKIEKVNPCKFLKSLINLSFTYFYNMIFFKCKYTLNYIFYNIIKKCLFQIEKLSLSMKII